MEGMISVAVIIIAMIVLMCVFNHGDKNYDEKEVDETLKEIDRLYLMKEQGIISAEECGGKSKELIKRMLGDSAKK